MAKINYLNNKDLLEEIHKSKTSYCTFTEKRFHAYDLIVAELADIEGEAIDEAKKNRAKRISQKDFEARKLAGERVKLADCEIDYTAIPVSELVFRVMTYDHIPLNPTRKKKPKTEADRHDKVNFPAFQHWKFNDDGVLICVGKSHWKGDLETGEFCKTHGAITNTLAKMYIKLCERYATRGNVRSYCVDTETEALTQRGWLGIDQITEQDTILSFTDRNLKWSSIKSIYRGEYNGPMHYITSRSMDALITPEHKLVTARGLVKAEMVKRNDKIIIMGDAVEAPNEKTYADSFVELVGWIVTEGCYSKGRTNQIGSISIFQNPGEKADRIRNCLTMLGYTFSESGSKNLCFRISADSTRKITTILPVKNLSMSFILKLTSEQRTLLINTMIDGDGWMRGTNQSYCQKDKQHIDLFQALLTISGKKSNYHLVTDHPSFNKFVNFYSVNIFSSRGNQTNGSCLNFNGGFNSGTSVNRKSGKAAFQNIPTTPYAGRVWCPETEYGCFVARRNGKVYLTGNTYNDEMRGQAILQLTLIGLQFNEAVSNNPFAYLTTAVTNSFVRIINIEKNNQDIRDDLLEMHGMNPSYSRTNTDEHESALRRYNDSVDSGRYNNGDD